MKQNNYGTFILLWLTAVAFGGLCILSPIHLKAQNTGAHLSDPSSSLFVFLRSKSDGAGGYRWMMKKAGKTQYSNKANAKEYSKEDGALYSTPGLNTKEWLNAVVPGTVLTSLVADGIYPDPYFGDNNRISQNLIPDIANVGREFYHYWYRTDFVVPKSFRGQQIWLKFHGINYRTVIWLNGHRLGEITGMFNSQAFDVTDIVDVNGNNGLAVDVLPVNNTGANLPPKNPMPGAIGEGQNGGDGEIGKNTTMLMSVGWDFTFPDGVRDRNTGIWKDVELFATGPVQIKNPYVQSILPLPDTTSARETISAELYNSTGHPQQGILKADIASLGIHIEKKVSLESHQTVLAVFDPAQYPALQLKNPKLWWPINKGPQHLYNLRLSFSVIRQQMLH